MTAGRRPGAEAVEAKGWIKANKWLLLRRASQLGVLGLFLLGPLAGIWLVKGNLAYSKTMEVLPLTDPHILLQAVLAGVEPHTDALIGVVIVVLLYSLIGGRVFCSWVCPVNLITDAACCVRRMLGIRSASQISRNSRYWLLGVTLILPLATGAIVWELVNPVSMAFRGILFGLGLAWVILLGVFLFDVFVSKDGWCGRLCPVGAFYSLLGRKSLIRVVAEDRDKCDDCMDCFEVCPEKQVIKPALKGSNQGVSPVILSAQCTNCGRCIDVCAEEVFHFGSRFFNQSNSKRAVAAGHAGKDVEKSFVDAA